MLDKKILKRQVREKKEKTETEKQQKQQPDDIGLTQKGHERALQVAYRSLVAPVLPKPYIDTYIDRKKCNIKLKIREQRKELDS